MSEPYDAELRRWDDKAATYRLEMLERTQDGAGKWQGTVSTLLGLFSAVAIVAGPKHVSDVEPEWLAPLVLIGVLASGGLAAASIHKAQVAARGASATWSNNLDGQNLRDYVFQETPKAISALNWSRILGVLAALLLFVTGFVIAVGAVITSAPASATTLVVVDDGGAYCGPLKVRGDGLVSVGGRAIRGDVELVTVPGC